MKIRFWGYFILFIISSSLLMYAWQRDLQLFESGHLLGFYTSCFVAGFFASLGFYVSSFLSSDRFPLTFPLEWVGSSLIVWALGFVVQPALSPADFFELVSVGGLRLLDYLSLLVYFDEGSLTHVSVLSVFIKFILFVCGGFVLLPLVYRRPSCSSCQRFLERNKVERLYFKTAQEAGEHLAKLRTLAPFSSNFFSEINKTEADFDPQKGSVECNFILSSCGHCGNQVLSQRVRVRSKRWKEVQKLNVDLRVPQFLLVEPDLSGAQPVSLGSLKTNTG